MLAEEPPDDRRNAASRPGYLILITCSPPGVGARGAVDHNEDEVAARSWPIHSALLGTSRRILENGGKELLDVPSLGQKEKNEA